MMSFLAGFAAGFITRDVMGPVGASGSILRPVAKQVVKGALIVGGAAKAATANVREQWGEVVASAEAEVSSRGTRKTSRAKA